MSGKDERASELRGLLIDMRTDVRALDRLYRTVGNDKIDLLTDESDEILVWGLAAWLHHIYTAVESLLERVAQVLDDYTSRAEDWHRRLLLNMREPIESVRPAVLSAPTFQWLDELRRFRHLFRHAYGAELDRTRIKELVVETLGMEEALSQDFKELEAFVEALLQHHGRPLT